jgi:CheY-like chemotaxis protein
MKSAEEKADILIVDDRLENLAAMQSVLEPLGQTLIPAHSGQEALKLLLDRDVAVILIDVNMPGMDGFETARLIRERERSRHIPIIFLTAYEPDPTKALKGYETGAVDFIFRSAETTDILRYKVSVFVELYKTRRRRIALEQEQEKIRALQAELSHYRTVVAQTALPVGEAVYGTTSIRATSDAAFEELMNRYDEILDKSLESRALKVSSDIPQDIRMLAESLGFLRAGPRDVIELHTQALTSKTKKPPAKKAQAFIEEGRFLVLELMGCLVSYYRKYYPGTQSVPAEKSPASKPSSKKSKGGEKPNE